MMYVPPSTAGQPFTFQVAPVDTGPFQPYIITVTEAYVPPPDTVVILKSAINAPGLATVTPSSMNGIIEGASLAVGLPPAVETVLVLSVTPTTFSADFDLTHPAGVPIYTDNNGTPMVVVTMADAPISGPIPSSYYKLYRATSPTGPWNTVVGGSASPSMFAAWTNLFDAQPLFGVQVYYAATVIDQDGIESIFSQPVPFIASQTQSPGVPLPSGPSISPGALGPYPLLGSDIYIDPVAREAVITPGGDLLLVNGLQCLGQDLRIRLLTEPGQLPLHPHFGLSRHGIIGTGQATPKAQAQLLRQRVMDALTNPTYGDPRINRVLEVLVYPRSAHGWIVDYTIEAIGVEGPTRANLVFPYYQQ